MTCAACVSHVSDAINSVQGVVQAEVSLVTNSANVNFDGAGSTLQAISEAVKEVGYSVDIGDVSGAATQLDAQDAQGSAARSELNATRNGAIFGIAAMLVIMLAMLARPSLLADVSTTALNIVFLTVVAPIQFWVGAPFYRSAWAAARRRTSNMNTLVVIGTSVAFAYSVIVTFNQAVFGAEGAIADAASFVVPEHHTGTYFEVSAAIIGLVSLGRWLEGRTRVQSSEFIRMLVQLQPRRALIERAGETIEVDVAEIGVGDVVLIRPGERIPADASIVVGSADVDESMLTGESEPVSRDEGEAVFAGTVNLGTSFRAKVASAGDSTLLAQIIRQVESAQASRAPIERFVDQVTARFVPTVIAIGLATFLVWAWLAPEPSIPNALLISVTVFVVACPCALGLATPTAIVAGIGRAAEFGILINNATTLERAATVRNVVFDKTGTLTMGKPSVISVFVRQDSGYTEDELLRFAASVEINSQHPIGIAIVAEARTRGIEIPQSFGFQSLTGRGVHAQVGGATVSVMKASTIALDDGNPISEAVERIASQAETPVVVSIEGQPLAVIGLRDAVRPEAKDAVLDLRQMRVNSHLLTGDRLQVAHSVANQVGIDSVDAQVLPTEKAARVDALMRDGSRTAMIGDGINDGPALATADVGVAMAGGADIAIEAADVTLINDDPGGVPRLITISRATVRVIRQNLFWAFAYNLALIPIAAGMLHPVFADSPPPGFLRVVISESGFLSPVAAAAAMAFSSLSVSLNSLKLRRTD